MAGYDKTSNRYFFKNWMNQSEEKENTIDEFLYWIKDNYTFSDFLQEHENVIIQEIEVMAKEFLGGDMKRIKAGEQEALKNWTKAVKDY